MPKKLVPPELLKVKYYEIELDKERKVLVLYPKPNFKPKPWVIELE
ncbi:MAG: hypothetical protein QXF61_07135 [Nitrososphaeria archaeon]